MRIVIDRLEEDKAVVELESGKMVVLPLEILCDAKEGDAIEITTKKYDKSENVDTKSIFEKLRKKSKNHE